MNAHVTAFAERGLLLSTFVIALIGCGSDTAFVNNADIEVTPQVIQFSQVLLGARSVQTVTLRSTGQATLVITGRNESWRIFSRVGFCLHVCRNGIHSKAHPVP